MIVNGPILQELNINSRNNLFGPGNRANSTIGRCIRLILMNACATTPGLFDRTIHGHPGKFSFCIGENEGETHWNPLHVERGFSREQSAVTVFASLGPRQVRMDHGPERILAGVADTASSLGTFMSTPLSGAPSPEKTQLALVVAGTSDVWEGWSKEDVRRVYVALDTREQYMLVDPTTQPNVPSFTGVPRLKDLRGKRLGLLDGCKPGGKELLEDLADLLRDRFGESEVMYHRKPSQSKTPTPKLSPKWGESVTTPSLPSAIEGLAARAVCTKEST